jgi:hypothetical protein
MLKAPYLVTYDDLWNWQSALTKAVPLQQQAMIVSDSWSASRLKCRNLECHYISHLYAEFDTANRLHTLSSSYAAG